MSQRSDEGGLGAFVWGTLVGTLIGAILAIFFAPRSGKDTLDELERTAAEARRQVVGDSLEESIAAGKAEARRTNQRP